ncbi:hypothetical protein BDF21DRAFT_433267, partial [Thamnidium elegans]
MRSVILFCLVLIFTSFVFAAEDGFTDFIIGLSSPVTKDKIKKAKADIEKAGGKILSEITLGIHGFVVSLPSDLVQSLDNKDYIDFIEEDQIAHAL